ncbi:MAG TPA: hypothetical protein VHA56_02645 [Mucilaginibacter sp.]|nr:hypothetical protein [Mucilaginibacter sp.]
MGQLDQIELNELFFIGYFVSIIPVYVSGGLESTLENVKIYIFSAVAAIAPGVANIPNKNPQNTYKIEYVRVEPRESRYWEVIVVPSSSSGNELNFRPGATFTTNNGKNRGVVFLAHETDP